MILPDSCYGDGREGTWQVILNILGQCYDHHMPCSNKKRQHVVSSCSLLFCSYVSDCVFQKIITVFLGLYNMLLYKFIVRAEGFDLMAEE